MASGYKGDSARLVSSEYLYKSLVQLDAKRDKALHDELFTDYKAVIEHYALASQQDGSEGLLIVDTVVSNPDTEVLLSDVQAKLLPDDLTVYAAGQYVVLVPEVPAYSEEVYLKKSAIDLDTVSKLSTIEETLGDGSKKQYLGFNNEKIETEIQTDLIPTKDSDKFVNSGTVYSSLYHTETVTVVDQEQYYNIATSGEAGALKVVLTVSDSSTEIALTDINTQTTPVDLSTLTGDGTEYVVLVPATTHDENVEKETYRKASESYSAKEVDDKLMEIASGGLKPETIDEYKAFMNGLEIVADGYVEPQP